MGLEREYWTAPPLGSRKVPAMDDYLVEVMAALMDNQSDRHWVHHLDKSSAQMTE